jgi:hypothetical protein
MSKEDAVALKEKGNAAFKAHNWPEAVDYYTKAIETYDKEPSFYTNRAQVRSLTLSLSLSLSPSLIGAC